MSEEIDREWICAKVFTFRALPRGEILSRELRFEPDGRLSGYQHRNETFWDLHDGRIRILSVDRVVTCVLTKHQTENGLISLVGAWLDPRRPAVDTETIHYIDENPAAAEPVDVSSLTGIMTFDLFDTLVARRCYGPLDIFRRVERDSGVKNFAKLRHEVEMRMFGKQAYGLDDVYGALAAETDWTEPLLQRLKLMELIEEWDNLFPIAAMTAKVRPQDMIISDMYLPYDFVKKIVEDKCGLKGNAIHLSNYGKHNTLIWPKLLPEFRISRHFGDNHHADVAGPGRFGIPAQHVTLSKWSAGEQVLLDLGLRRYAEPIRLARLSSHDADPARHAARQAQFEVNLPLLTVASLFALQQARETDSDVLLLCARDCNLWAPLLRLLASRFPHAPRVEYIRASRAAFYERSPEYAAYFCRFLGGRNILVDLVGTGSSPSCFLQWSGLEPRVRLLFLATDPTPSGIPLTTLTQQPFHMQLNLEGLNMSLEPRTIGTRFSNYTLDFKVDASEFGASARDLIGAMRDAFYAGLTALEAMQETAVPHTIPVTALRQAAEAIIASSPWHAEAISQITDDISQNIAK